MLGLPEVASAGLEEALGPPSVEVTLPPLNSGLTVVEGTDGDGCNIAATAPAICCTASGERPLVCDADEGATAAVTTGGIPGLGRDSVAKVVEGVEVGTPSCAIENTENKLQLHF